jgi:hypothetical protein
VFQTVDLTVCDIVAGDEFCVFLALKKGYSAYLTRDAIKYQIEGQVNYRVPGLKNIPTGFVDVPLISPHR